VPFLVDTDWIIHFLNGRSDIIAKLQELSVKGVAISMISLAELYEGVYYSRNQANDEAALRDFVRTVSVLGIDEEVTRIFGRERGRLRSLGKTVGDLDLLIGATAIQHDLTLLTNNRRHFELLERLRIVSI
jgi:tRNA(fMet)-specific endonuclease VapC